MQSDRRFRGAYYLHHKGDEVIALMMEAVSTSETSVYFYQTIRRNIPEDSHIRNPDLQVFTQTTNQQNIHPGNHAAVQPAVLSTVHPVEPSN
jgi:hypothetical protein